MTVSQFPRMCSIARMFWRHDRQSHPLPDLRPSVLSFARVVSCAIGLDTTKAMLFRANELQHQRKITNAAWVLGEAGALPFPSASFDIVTCRFAFHHMQRPAETFHEMIRLTRPGGRIIVCDAVASEDAVKADVFNDFERLRDRSTVRFLSAAELRALYEAADLPVEAERAYRVPTELAALLKASFPAPDDLPKLQAAAQASIDDDSLGINTRQRGNRILRLFRIWCCRLKSHDN